MTHLWESREADAHPTLEVGISVAGLAPGCLGTHAYTLCDLTVPIPRGTTFVEACTMVTVFVTVDLILCHAGHLPAFPHQPVLVHAAAGGIGLAACQVVQALGSSMCATAGSSLKRHLLRSLGVGHVVSSRSTEYADLGPRIADANAPGVGLVLNSLTSSGMVGASLSSLSTGGEFIEIGKRDIWSTGAVHQERPDVSYHLVAMDFLPPARNQKVLCRLACGIAEGTVVGLRSTSHPLNNTQSALRWLAGAKHVGKVVVSQSLSTPRLLSMQQSGCCFVTGGLGALGSVVAQWASQHLSPELRLAGRSGHYKLVPGSSEALQILQSPASSAVLSAVRCDAGSREECASATSWSGLRSPVAQVMHAGGVLADMLLGSQTMQSMRTVFAPKVDALHGMYLSTWGHTVHSQLLFSSVASLLGSAGQSNYSAANAYLDSWSCALETQGGCATSIQWGAWASGGMAMQHSSTAARLERVGMPALSVEEGLRALRAALGSMSSVSSLSSMDRVSVVSAVPFVWERFLRGVGPDVKLFDDFRSSDATQVDVEVSASKPLLAGTWDKEVIRTTVNTMAADVLGRSMEEDEPL
ncbi:MAG: KR domain-containing protein, partial [Cyanobacteriota bacterium]|nr:KR domain-containing protein [Cyanobacteriota bacterium]